MDRSRDSIGESRFLDIPRNTEKYVHWNQQLYHERNDRYNFAAASTIEQVQPLIENGFEYVCDLEGMKLFRKPK